MTGLITTMLWCGREGLGSNATISIKAKFIEAPEKESHFDHPHSCVGRQTIRGVCATTRRAQ